MLRNLFSPATFDWLLCMLTRLSHVKNKDIDKICAYAMVIIRISCFRKKNGTGFTFTKQGADLPSRQSRITWGRGRSVWCTIVGGSSAVSVLATTDVSRDFWEQFFTIVGLWNLSLIFLNYTRRRPDTNGLPFHLGRSTFTPKIGCIKIQVQMGPKKVCLDSCLASTLITDPKLKY